MKCWNRSNALDTYVWKFSNLHKPWAVLIENLFHGCCREYYFIMASAKCNGSHFHKRICECALCTLCDVIQNFCRLLVSHGSNCIIDSYLETTGKWVTTHTEPSQNSCESVELRNIISQRSLDAVAANKTTRFDYGQCVYVQTLCGTLRNTWMAVHRVEPFSHETTHETQSFLSGIDSTVRQRHAGMFCIGSKHLIQILSKSPTLVAMNRQYFTSLVRDISPSIHILCGHTLFQSCDVPSRVYQGLPSAIIRNEVH